MAALRYVRVVGAAALTATLFFSGAAHAQGGETEARTRYAKGVELYTDGAFVPALAELERAYQLSPNYRVLYSIGLVKTQLSDFVGAYRALQEYLAAANDESEQRKTEVRQRIDQLKERIGTMDIRVNVDGAEIYIDDQLSGASPLAQPVLVNPGRHLVYAKKKSVRTDSKSVLLAGGEKQSVALDLAPEPDSQRRLQPLEPVRPAGSGSHIVPILWITTGVLAAGAITTGVFTLSARSSLADSQKRPTSGEDLASQEKKVQTLALVSDVLAVAAVAAGGISLYFTLKRPSQSANAATLPSTWVRALPGGVGLGQSF